jgi:hypothetical protein
MPEESVADLIKKACKTKSAKEYEKYLKKLVDLAAVRTKSKRASLGNVLEAETFFQKQKKKLLKKFDAPIIDDVPKEDIEKMVQDVIAAKKVLEEKAKTHREIMAAVDNISDEDARKMVKQLFESGAWLRFPQQTCAFLEELGDFRGNDLSPIANYLPTEVERLLKEDKSKKFLLPKKNEASSMALLFANIMAPLFRFMDTPYWQESNTALKELAIDISKITAPGSEKLRLQVIKLSLYLSRTVRGGFPPLQHVIETTHVYQKLRSKITDDKLPY